MTIDIEKSKISGAEDLGKLAKEYGGKSAFCVILDEEEKGIVITYGETRSHRRRMNRYINQMGFKTS